MNEPIAKRILKQGGSLIPLIVPPLPPEIIGQMNPSVFVDSTGSIFVNIRCTNYVLVHCENNKMFPTFDGRLVYKNPENDVHLRTVNVIAELDEDMEVKYFAKVDTSKLDNPVNAEFIGLEDARLVEWESKFYMSGVRRDTQMDGKGRIELSEIAFSDGTVTETARYRIEPPKQSFLEKNWMPVLDMPFHFVKWTNPTEVVKVNPENHSSETVFLGENTIQGLPDLRGGSQVVQFGIYRMAIVHQVRLWKNEMGQKDGEYMHRIIIWDNDWNIVRIGNPFRFLGADIEFCCGLAQFNDTILITFGFQDNAAYLLQMPFKVWGELAWNI